MVKVNIRHHGFKINVHDAIKRAYASHDCSLCLCLTVQMNKVMKVRITGQSEVASSTLLTLYRGGSWFQSAYWNL